MVTGREGVGLAEHHAAPHFLVVNLRQVQRHAFARAGFGGVFAIDLHAPDVAGPAGGQQRQRIADAHAAAAGNAGDDRAWPANGEDVLDPDAEKA